VNPLFVLILGCLWIGTCPKCLFCIEKSDVCILDSPTNLCSRHFDTIGRPCVRFPCTILKHCTHCGIRKDSENRLRKLRILRALKSADIFNGNEEKMTDLRAGFTAMKAQLNFFVKCVDNSLPTEPIPSILIMVKSFIRDLQAVKESPTQEIVDLEKICIYLSEVLERGSSDVVQVASLISPYLRILLVPDVHVKNRAAVLILSLEPKEVVTMLEKQEKDVCPENYKKFLVILARLEIFRKNLDGKKVACNPLDLRSLQAVEQTESLDVIIADIEFLVRTFADGAIQQLLKDILIKLRHDRLQDDIIIADITDFLKTLLPIVKVERAARMTRMLQKWETILSLKLLNQFNTLLGRLDVLRKIKHFSALEEKLAAGDDRATRINPRDKFAYLEQQKVRS
jgi:hypothetical protein